MCDAFVYDEKTKTENIKYVIWGEDLIQPDKKEKEG